MREKQGDEIQKKPVSLTFSGLVEDIESLKKQEVQTAALDKENSEIPKRIALLEQTALTLKGRDINGYELLEIIQTLTHRNRMSVSKNLKRLGIIASVATIVPGLIMFICTTDSRKDQAYFWTNTFRNAARTADLATLLEIPDYQVSNLLSGFQNLGLIDFKEGYDKNIEGWKLSPKGINLLKQWQKGTPARADFTAPATTGQKQTLPPAIIKPGLRTLTTEQRLKLIQALTTEYRQGANAWDMLKLVAKPSESFLTRMLQKGISEKNLFLQMAGDMKSGTFREKLQELRQLGLLANIRPSEQAENSRWALTEFAKTLLKEPDLVKALEITDTDVQTLVDQQIQSLEAEKLQKATELQELKDKLKASQDALEPIQTQWQAAEAKALELDSQRGKCANEESEDALANVLQEQLLQARLVEEKMKFHQTQATQLERQLKATKTYQNQWVQRVNANILRLHQSLYKLQQQQGERAVHEVMKELQDIHEQMDEHHLTRERQMQDLMAMLSPTLPNSEEEETTPLDSAALHGKELANLTIEQQMAPIRQRQKSAQ